MFPARSLHAWLRTLGLTTVALFLILLACGALVASRAFAQDAAPDQPVAPAIVGGRDADPGAWPWQVALLDRFGSGNPRGFFCGGSLIAPDWVLTAAHCVFEVSSSRIDVLLGSNRLTEAKVRLPIDRKIVNSNYDPEGIDGDVALLHLTQPTTITTIQPYTLGLGTVETDYLRATVTGWGINAESLIPDALQEVSLPIIDYKTCAQRWGEELPLFTDRLICAGYNTMTKATCSGDSGGPLVVQLADSTWRQIGIVYGGPFGCVGAPYPDIFTRVAKYADWIQTCVANPDAPTCNGADDYEPDDTPAAARPITSLGMAQVHTFHTANDVDWVKLDVKAGHRYVLETRRVYSDVTTVDTVLWLYAADGRTALAFDEGPNSYSPGQRGKMVTDAALTYVAPADATIYASVENLAPSYFSVKNYGPGVRYELTVRDAPYQMYLPALARGRVQ